jgi:hypothetical protein
MAIVAGAGQAEYSALHERMALPIPDGMSFEDAAAIPEAFLTAYDALFARGRLCPGETVLIHAAASGVGLAAAAIASASGAKVIALTRSEEKRRKLSELGYETARPRAGVNVVIDFLGASSWAENVEVLAPLGRLVLVGTLSGSKVEADLSPGHAEASHRRRHRPPVPAGGGEDRAHPRLRPDGAAAPRGGTDSSFRRPCPPPWRTPGRATKPWSGTRTSGKSSSRYDARLAYRPHIRTEETR